MTKVQNKHKREVEALAPSSKLTVWGEKHSTQARMVRHNQHQSDGPTRGHVARVLSDKNGQSYGFIRSHDSDVTAAEGSSSRKDAGWSGSSDVFFHGSKVISAGFDLCPGDEVEFTLERPRHGAQDNRKRSARQVRLVRAGKLRPVAVYENWISKMEESLEVHNGLLKALECHATWQTVFSAPNLSADMHTQLMNLCILLKMRSRAHQEGFACLAGVIAQSRFFNPANGGLSHFIQAAAEEQNDEDMQLVANFLLAIVRAQPSFSHTAMPFLELLIKHRQAGLMDRCLMDFLKAMAAGESNDVRCMAWNELPLVPTTSELCDHQHHDEHDGRGTTEHDWNVLHAVRESGAYESAEQYLDTYFRLLREDCFSALKEGVNNLLSGKLDLRDMHVYSDVKLVALQVPQSVGSLSSGNGGIHLALQIKPCREVRSWSHAPNLMFGNLLCISTTGDFKRPLWATVANRDTKLLDRDNIIFVEPCSELGGSNMADFVSCLQQASAGSTVMVESPTYYRAYQPILRALQNTKPHELAFFEEIVKAKTTDARPPEYLEEASDVMLKDVKCLYKEGRCPLVARVTLENVVGTLSLESDDLAVDGSQREAVSHALTHRVALVQGPPGTGKTYIGVKLVQLILSASTCPDTPILVLTYKNHALDEFLLTCDKLFPREIVRVGGRSSEARLEEHNLSNLCRSRSRPRNAQLDSNFYDARNKIDSLRPVITAAADKVASDSRFSTQCFLRQAGLGQIRHLLLGARHLSGIAMQCRHQLLHNFMGALEPEFIDELESSEEVRKVLETGVGAALRSWLPPPSVFAELQQQLTVASAVDLSSRMGEAQQLSRAASNDEDTLHDEDDVQALLQERMASYGFHHQPTDVENTMAFLAKMKASGWPLFLPGMERLADSIATSLLNEADIWHMNMFQRAQLVQVMLHRQVRTSRRQLLERLQDFSSACREFSEVDSEQKVEVLRQRRIVGMTVTGAAINQQLLTALQPAIVLVEEAAEVLEPQLLAVLGPWVQHLILIGDHQQLRPPVESYQLVRNYHFDVSMMERLLNNKMPHALLLTQNRMRPEFSALLKDIYPRLGDNLSVVSRNEAPACVEKSMFFWDHEDPEIGGRSYVNKGEVERVVKLALYFIQQGYMPWKITVLSAYQGQTIVLRRELRQRLKEVFDLDDHPDLRTEKKPDQRNTWEQPKEVLVHTIDRYQGDENEIVIVSLVRSNSDKKIGFLKTLNRRCVAQSRARCGMFFVGNKKCLGSCDHWRRLVSGMEDAGCVGRVITLRCPRHPTKSLMHARTAQDIKLGKTGFCDLPCGQVMDCGSHICRKNCQPAHPHKVCRQEVEFVFSACRHNGRKLCYQDEKTIQCQTVVTFKCLSGCGTQYERKCYDRRAEHALSMRCTQQVRAELPCCHSATKPCNQSIRDTPCEFPCRETRRQCGHQCSARCGHSGTCDDKTCTTCEEERKKRHEEYKKEIAEQIQRSELERKEINDAAVACASSPAMEYALLDNTSIEFIRIRDKSLQLLRDALPAERHPQVSEVKELRNPALKLRYLKAKAKLFGWEKHSVPELLPFDAEIGKYNEKLLECGLPLKDCGELGKAIEFKNVFELKSASGVRPNYLLLCDVLVGESQPWTSNKTPTENDVRSRRVDSLIVQEGNRLLSSYVYSIGQVLPRYLVEYTCKPLVQVLRNTIEKEALSLDQHMVVPIESQRESVGSVEEGLFRTAESQFLRQKTQFEGKKLSVTSVNYFVTPRLVSAFAAKQQEINEKYPGGAKGKKKLRHPIWAFHSTDKGNVSSIMQNNFKLDMVGESTRCAGKFGAGIYFSEFPDYALKYGGKEKALLLCYVLPGKSFPCTRDMVKTMLGTGLKDGYDSHQYDADEAGYGKEVCVFDTTQILPCFEINYKEEVVVSAGIGGAGSKALTHGGTGSGGASAAAAATAGAQPQGGAAQAQGGAGSTGQPRGPRGRGWARGRGGRGRGRGGGRGRKK